MRRYPGKMPRVSPREQLELVARAQAGETDALHRLILCNVPLVIQAAARYRWSGLDMEDLVAHGVLGLFEAMKRFDPGRGVLFMSYAIAWVRRSIQVFVGELMAPVHIPQRKVGAGCRPQALPLEDRGAAGTLVPLEERLEQQVFASPLAALEGRDAAEQVRELLLTLDSRTRYVITGRYGVRGRRRMTLEAIGRRLGICKEAVRLIEVGGLEEMRWAAMARTHRRSRAA